MPKLYVVRHAEPSVQGTLLGRTDPPLSEAGLREARLLWPRLPVAVVYTSPLRRCRQTAQFASAPIIVLDGLTEISLGEWDGLRWSEVVARDPDLARRKLDDWLGITPPGGESWTGFRNRVRAALDVIRAGPLPAAVVGHVAVNAVITAELSNADPAAFDQRYSGVLTIDISAEERSP